MMNVDETSLIKRAQHGDQASFGLLIATYLSSVYAVAFRFVKNAENAEDLTQDVFLRVWKKIKKVDAEKPFHPWLFTVTKNIARDFLKKKKSIPLSHLGDEDLQQFFLDQLIDTHPNPAQIVAQQEEADQLHAHLKKLSLKHRTVVLLHNMKEWTFQEIATHLKEPLHTIKSRHRRALITLRKSLSESR